MDEKKLAKLIVWEVLLYKYLEISFTYYGFLSLSHQKKEI